MKWTEVPSGTLRAAENRLYPLLGEDARKVIEKMKNSELFAKTIAEFMIEKRKRIIVVDHRITVGELQVFIGNDWKVSYSSEDEVRAEKLLEIDLDRIHLETCFDESKRLDIDGNSKFQQLQVSQKIRLDVSAFMTFWKTRFLIPEFFENKGTGIRYIYFYGTLFTNKNGGDGILRLYQINKKWKWDICRVGTTMGSHDFAAMYDAPKE